MSNPTNPPAAKPKKSGCLLKILAAIFIPLGALIIFGLLSDRAESAAKAAHTEVMAPYFQALHEGRLREAYDNFTSDAYKQEFPWERWKAAQTAHAPWKASADITAPTAREASNTLNGVKIKYNFMLELPDDKTPVLMYDVIQTPAGRRINRSYRMTFRSFRNSNGNTSSDSVDSPEPW